MTPRLHRWLTALVILATVAVAIVVIGQVAALITYFSDVIMIFFLAWLLAFILSPLASALVHLIPRLPRAVAVILVYALLIVLLVAAILLVAQQLYSSITKLVTNWPTGDRLATTPPALAEPPRLHRRPPDQPLRAGQPAAGEPQERCSTTGPAARRHRRRQPWHVRQPALRLLPVVVHGRRPGPDRQLPLPSRPARVHR